MVRGGGWSSTPGFRALPLRPLPLSPELGRTRGQQHHRGPEGARGGRGMGSGGHGRLPAPMLHARSRRRLPPPALRGRGGLGASRGTGPAWAAHGARRPPDKPGHRTGVTAVQRPQALLGPAAAAAPEDEHAKRERSGRGAVLGEHGTTPPPAGSPRPHRYEHTSVSGPPELRRCC